MPQWCTPLFSVILEIVPPTPADVGQLADTCCVPSFFETRRPAQLGRACDQRLGWRGGRQGGWSTALETAAEAKPAPIGVSITNRSQRVWFVLWFLVAHDVQLVLVEELLINPHGCADEPQLGSSPR